MITEAIVLAGGLGTRLRSVVADLPKSLAPIAGKPFLSYLLDYSQKQGIKKFIFALGYKTELIEEFIEASLPADAYSFSIEQDPLGTGGAIYQAASGVSGEQVFVLNADTFFAVPLHRLSTVHENRQAETTLALKPMKDFDRYGVVSLDDFDVVNGFSEKKYHVDGLINGGLYALNVNSFLRNSFPPKFSFEKDYLEKKISRGTNPWNDFR